ncbi:hypothetical protein LSH36_55g02026 [Paralvinella palmiformis]|uniref:Uncharacterized protein n=1 Tax=Paralvinella palmiformis TaxID=53620 RepID=A0AAD9K584_9ANNE|nr:hypothetical protein LSH36_55g02026 [Paralvinella palmiformis]
MSGIWSTYNIWSHDAPTNLYNDDDDDDDDDGEPYVGPKLFTRDSPVHGESPPNWIVIFLPAGRWRAVFVGSAKSSSTSGDISTFLSVLVDGFRC